ncbi:29929_t:CDS:2, partial [Gigaspora margarita]
KDFLVIGYITEQQKWANLVDDKNSDPKYEKLDCGSYSKSSYKRKPSKRIRKQNIRFDNKENKDRLINLLENQLAEDMKKTKIAHNQINSISNEENRHIFEMNKFPLNSGWALKANQKFGRKGTGKRISPEIRVLLEEYFLAGNINKSDKYTAQDMHDELVRHVQESEIKVEEVPKVATIQNWIGHYVREHKQEAAARKSN